jgi:hypothetical protein
VHFCSSRQLTCLDPHSWQFPLQKTAAEISVRVFSLHYHYSLTPLHMHSQSAKTLRFIVDSETPCFVALPILMASSSLSNCLGSPKLCPRMPQTSNALFAVWVLASLHSQKFYRHVSHPVWFLSLMFTPPPPVSACFWSFSSAFEYLGYFHMFLRIYNYWRRLRQMKASLHFQMNTV